MNDHLSPNTTMALLGANNAQSTRALEHVKASKADNDMQKLEDAAEDFEAVFLAEMMKPMFETVEVDDTFGGGKGEEVFRSFLVQEYGKILAATGNVGISQEVKQALIDIQEGANGTPFASTNITPKDEGK